MKKMTLEVVPLGGLGEFGMHMMAFRSNGTIIVVDAGVMFPDEELLGVDIIVPDITYLLENKNEVQAIFLTHGHEDHIGALPFILPYLNVPVFGSNFTMALVKNKLGQHGMLDEARLHIVKDKDEITAGCFSVQFFHVTHSIVDAFALAIKTPAGTVIHTGDFKIDPTPIDGKLFDLHTLAAYGDQGVLALFSDSTNAEHAGYTLSERSVNDRFESIFRTSQGRIILSCFTSSIPRLQLVIDQAQQYGRCVSFLGRRMIENTETAEELGFLKVSPGLVIRAKEIRSYPRDKVCVVAGGCQGEPMSALSRLALDDHKDLKIEEGDTVVLSARHIPGNERAIGRMMDHFYRRRAEIYYADGSQPPVHVSGHASEEELKLVVTLVKPKYFIPIHGTYRQLHRHAKLVEKTSVVSEKVIIVETGDILRFDPAGAEIAGKAPVGRVLIDEGSLEEVEEVVIRDRRHIAEDGIILSIIAINKQTGMMEIPPEIIFRGVAFLEEERLLTESRHMLFDTINNATVEERGDWTVIKEKIRKDLRKFFYKQTAKRPFILPVILEI
ncbi:MAG: ribonuclease J [Acidobacteria bacterium]|nr:MAG: ribonuclease J [Acidobacteriota bacterium]